MAMNPSLVPEIVAVRGFGQAAAQGEGKYMRDLYVDQRADAAIKTGREMTAKAKAIADLQFLAVTAGRAGGRGYRRGGSISTRAHTSTK